MSARLPPWGQMNEDFVTGIARRSMAPDWRPLGGARRSKKRWRMWRAHLIGQIAGAIWPVYQPDGARWSDDAVQRLFDADFRLLAKLHPHLHRPIRAAAPTTVAHAVFFAEEDGNVATPFGTGYERYDPLLPQDVRLDLIDVMNDGIQYKVAELDLSLKQVFQRPRPWQVAYIQGRSGYAYREAHSANTPSLVSGHCLEGSIGGCNAFVELSARMSSKSIRTLCQFTVDIGDRRVFAGIHYPSDNLSSWITAFHLVPHVFRARTARRVRAFLWTALDAHSAVFAAVRRHVTSHKHSPYRKALEALTRLGSGR